MWRWQRPIEIDRWSLRPLCNMCVLVVSLRLRSQLTQTTRDGSSLIIIRRKNEKNRWIIVLIQTIMSFDLVQASIVIWFLCAVEESGSFFIVIALLLLLWDVDDALCNKNAQHSVHCRILFYVFINVQCAQCTSKTQNINACNSMSMERWFVHFTRFVAILPSNWLLVLIQLYAAAATTTKTVK